MRVGSDTGGTFTDLVGEDGTVLKVPSTPHDPGEAVRGGLARLIGGEGPDVLAHGTTVATNALLERRGAVTALVTNEGFADVVEIARQDRPSLYDPFVDRPDPLVRREHRYEVPGRLGADGRELVPVAPARLGELADEVESVAVVLLHADLAADHELAVEAELVSRGHQVTRSSAISPEFREYERTSTTVLNAYLGPVCRRYLEGLGDAAAEVLVMTSAGGLVPVSDAAARPAALLLSGPAGGVAAAAVAAEANGYPDAVSFDMGGTSTDVCLIRGGRPEPAAQRSVAGFPVRLPSLDVHTIGAGGGSIAQLDPGGALVVGPRSAGAVPGPACYRRGGFEPTVTDADLVAGRLPAGVALPGIGVLDLDAATSALARVGVDALDVVKVVDVAMELAVRAVTVARGVDPRGLALVAFGGAGPLHACALAEALGMRAVIVPARAGVLSAVGILGAARQVDLVRSWPTPTAHDGLAGALEALASEALAAATSDGGTAGAHMEGRVELSTAVDCRYAGQSHELTVTSPGAFAAEHEVRNGYRRDESLVEVVALRATCRIRPSLDVRTLPAPERETGPGPRVIAEADCTIWVPAGWAARRGAHGALVLERTS